MICAKERSREMYATLRQEVVLEQLSWRKGFHFGSLLKILGFFKLVTNFVVNSVRFQEVQPRNFVSSISRKSLSGW